MSELLGASTDVLDRIAHSMNTDARLAQDIRARAQRAVTELQSSWNGSDLMRLTQEWDQHGSLLLAGACTALATCAAQLGAQSTAQRLASGTDAGGSPAKAAPMPPLAPPAMGGSPARTARWWRSMSPRQQQQLVTEHPDWVGSRDGVPGTARDLANRARVSVERARLLVEKQRIMAAGNRLKVALLGTPSEGVRTRDTVALDQVSGKLASLAAIDLTLALPGDRQLLMLDLSKPRAQAAIAQGNVDTADNVAVFVPGMSANAADGLISGDKNMGELRRQTELESRRAHTDESAAAVIWVGYQAPQMGWDLIGASSVATSLAAREGAAQLVPFLQGIGAARDKDPHLTLLGHSYGSTTAGLALRQSTGVDDAVFFGSPGIGTSHVQDLRLDPGHAYYIEARQDLVGDLGRFYGPFGIDPSHLAGIEKASALDSTVVDPLTGEIRRFTEVTGHSSYLLDQSTSQYNMAVVAAGLPDARVHDDGEGVGDVLSWPIPGTY